MSGTFNGSQSSAPSTRSGGLPDTTAMITDLARMLPESGTAIPARGCHTYCATGTTDYLTNSGRIEVAQRMAGHSNAKTTGMYERRNDDIRVGEVEEIGI